MGSQVTYCIECGACNWAGVEKCRVCGGELEPTLGEVHTYLYTTDPEFRAFVDEEHRKLKGGKPTGTLKAKYSLPPVAGRLAPNQQGRECE